MRAFAEDLADAHAAPLVRLRELRNAGGTRVGFEDEFYQLVALSVRHSEHPVKACAALHGVDKSTASRWLATARTKGYA